MNGGCWKDWAAIFLAYVGPIHVHLTIPAYETCDVAQSQYQS